MNYFRLAEANYSKNGPNKAKNGTDTLIFTYTQSNGNPFVIKEAITVDSIGNINFTGLNDGDEYCVDNGNVSIEADLVPGKAGTGLFSGPIGLSDIGVGGSGKNEGLVVPTILKEYSSDAQNVQSKFDITYTYTRTFSGCKKSIVKEVKVNYECGLNIAKFNDIKVGDVIEAYHEVEVAPKL